MNNHTRESSHRVDSQALHDIVNKIRVDNGMTWSEVLKEIGLHKDYFIRLRSGRYKTLAADALVSIMMWVHTYSVNDCFFEIVRERDDDE